MTRRRRCASRDFPQSFIRPMPGSRERILDALETYRRSPARTPDRRRGVQLARGLSLAGPGTARHGGGLPELPSFLTGTPDLELPFWSPRYDASLGAVQDAMAQDIDNDELLKVSNIRANDISSSTWHRGHTQGIALGSGVLLTSVEEKRTASNESYSGHLQVYSLPIADGDSPIFERKLFEDTPGAVAGHRWSHAVVGQGVIGKAVTDYLDNVHPNLIGMLTPLTHGLQGAGLPDPPNDGAPTDLRDKFGNVISTHFVHNLEQHENDKRPELQAPALIVFNGNLYLVAVRHQFLYVYQLHWMGAANSDAVVVWEKLVELDTMDTDECIREGDYDNLDFPNYDAINLLQTEEGHVLLLGSHAHWLDTWHLGLLNPRPPGEPVPKAERPVLTKLAICDQNWVNGAGADLFQQGLATFQNAGDKNTIGFAAAPKDYTHIQCGNAFGDAMCTDIYFWERHFG